MKRIAVIIFLCMFMCLGCENEHPQKTGDSVKVTQKSTIPSTDGEEPPVVDEPAWFEKIKSYGHSTYEWAGPVVETLDAFYYIAEDGLWRYDRTTDEDALCFSSERLTGVYQNDGSVYFCDGKSIYCGKSAEPVWDVSMCPEECWFEGVSINDFKIHDGTLYIRVEGLNIIKYDLDEGVSQCLIMDVEHMTVCGNTCYFGDHATRTFSIYRLDMDTGEVEMIIGDGKDWNDETKTRYDSAISHHGKLYYTVRGIPQIYIYNEDGEDNPILDELDEASIIRILYNSAYENLCYWIDDGTQVTLCEYDAQGNITELLRVDKKDDPYFTASVWVVDSAVFWKNTEDGAVQCVTRP